MACLLDCCGLDAGGMVAPPGETDGGVAVSVARNEGAGSSRQERLDTLDTGAQAHDLVLERT